MPAQKSCVRWPFARGMTTLREDTWSKVKQGVTTVEEAIRVTTDAW